MYRITLAYFMRLGEEIQRLRGVRVGSKFEDVQYILLSALRTFQEVESSQVMAHVLRACYGPLRETIAALKTFEGEHDENRTFDFMDDWRVTDPLNRMYTVLSAELQVANAYVVLNKGAYDTQRLLYHGEALFPEELLYKVPATEQDVKNAGQCLAFEMGTACGFHVLRALEAVVIKYWDAVSGGLPLPEPRSLGRYLDEMSNKKFGDKPTIAALKQIKNLHRNPLMHPEVHLDAEEAIALVGMSHSAIRAMLPAIPDPPA